MAGDFVRRTDAQVAASTAAAAAVDGRKGGRGQGGHEGRSMREENDPGEKSRGGDRGGQHSGRGNLLNRGRWSAYAEWPFRDVSERTLAIYGATNGSSRR